MICGYIRIELIGFMVLDLTRQYLFEEIERNELRSTKRFVQL